MIEGEPTMGPRLEKLLHDEIIRGKKLSVFQPPAGACPLTLEQYRRQLSGRIIRPSMEQSENFIRAIQDDAVEIFRSAPAGSKVLPVLMLADHTGFPFDTSRINAFGNLYYYVVTQNNMALRADGSAFLDAVFPQEILALAVPLPVDILDPEQSRQFFMRLRQRVDKLLSFCK